MAIVVSVLALIVYLVFVYFFIIKRSKGNSKSSNSTDQDVASEVNILNIDEVVLEFPQELKEQTKKELQQRLVDTFRAIKSYEKERFETDRQKNKIPSTKEIEKDVITEINEQANRLNTEVDPSNSEPSKIVSEVDEIEWITDNEIDY